MDRYAAGSAEERRIWVGNLDPRLTEFQLLKIVQKCGPIEKFDMLFYKGGQSRGYAFITFATINGAIKAMEKLNGTTVINRAIIVRLAKNVNYDELEKPKPRIEIPALGSGMREAKISKDDAIRAIEAKLKSLERSHDSDLEFNTCGLVTNGPQIPFIQKYQFNKDREVDTNQRVINIRSHGKISGPYHRHQRPKRR